MFEEKNETIMDDQHYSVRRIRDFIQNLQQPMVYVVCAKCMWNRFLNYTYIYGSQFLIMIICQFFFINDKKLFCLIKFYLDNIKLLVFNNERFKVKGLWFCFDNW